MENAEILKKIERFGVTEKSGQFYFESKKIKELFEFCLNEKDLRFDYLECITAVDSGQDFFLIYKLRSMTLGHGVILQTSIDRHDSKIDSVKTVWSAAIAYEQECSELFGIEFFMPGVDASEKVQLFLTKDWYGHPFRKDYVFPDEVAGVEHRRAPLRKEHSRP